MTFWKMNGHYAPVTEALSPQRNPRRSHGIINAGKFVELRRLHRPEVCEHGHAIAANEILVELVPLDDKYGTPSKKYCLNHAPLPTIKFLAVKPKGTK